MTKTWQKSLARWHEAGLVDSIAVERIRRFEGRREPGVHWAVVMAWALGGILLASGILLFVASHWERLSPGSRFSAVLAGVLLFHLAGALFAPRHRLLSSILHAVGTVALGGGIFLAGQIFHLQEHWPGGIFLWAAGAWMAWAILRDWIQLVLAAILTPYWLVGEWFVANRHLHTGDTVAAIGIVLLAITYFTAPTSKGSSPFRTALAWIGGLALIPSVLFLASSDRGIDWSPIVYLGLSVAYAAPVGVAILLRGKRIGILLVSLGWVTLLAWFRHDSVAPYFLCLIFSVFLTWWGFDEGRRERISMGVAGFGLTVLLFYFSNVMDMLERSLSLIGLGILFMGLGWALMRVYGRLTDKLSEGES